MPLYPPLSPNKVIKWRSEEKNFETKNFKLCKYYTRGTTIERYIYIEREREIEKERDRERERERGRERETETETETSWIWMY